MNTSGTPGESDQRPNPPEQDPGETGGYRGWYVPSGQQEYDLQAGGPDPQVGSPWPGREHAWPDAGWRPDSGTAPPTRPAAQPAAPPPPTPPAPYSPPPDWRAHEDWLVPVRRRRRFPGALLVLAVVGTLLVVSAGGAGAYYLLRGRVGADDSGHAAVQVADKLFAAPQVANDGVHQVINDVAAMGNTVVAVGSEYGGAASRPRFLVSTDGGRTWQVGAVRPGEGGLQAGPGPSSIAATPGAWLAIGGARDRRVVWTSNDGKTWTEQGGQGAAFDPGDKVSGIARTPDGYVMVGYNTGSDEGDHDDRPAVWLSRTGEAWQRIGPDQLDLPVDKGSARHLDHAAAYGGAVVAGGDVTRSVGDGEELIDGFWRSTDGGRSWKAVTVPQADGSSGLAGGLAATSAGFFVLRQGSNDNDRYGVVLHSQDGQDWQLPARVAAPSGMSPAFRDLAGNDQGLAALAVSDDDRPMVFRSRDGRQWRWTANFDADPDRTITGLAPTASGTTTVGAVTDGADQDFYLAVTDGSGRAAPVDLSRVPGAVNPEHDVRDVLAAGKAVVAVGSVGGLAAAWSSSDGTAWKPARFGAAEGTVQTASNAGRQRLSDVAYGPQGWLTVGVDSGAPLVVMSRDAQSWSRVDAGPFAASDDAELGVTAATYGPDGYVIVGINKGEKSAGAAVWHYPMTRGTLRPLVPDLPLVQLSDTIGVRHAPLPCPAAPSTAVVEVPQALRSEPTYETLWRQPRCTNGS